MSSDERPNDRDAPGSRPQNGEVLAERTLADRVDRIFERIEAAGARDKAAGERDAEAGRRDELAMHRDRAALARDTDTEERELYREDAPSPSTEAVQQRAAAARRFAADDRFQAAGDRLLDSVDRQWAAQDRGFSREDREQAAHDRWEAGTDELTGARRRGVGLQELQREIDRSRRTGDRIVAAFVDVDGLKAVNDGLGHGAGDRLLREVVAGLQRDMRSYDLVVRLGGDEFLCMLTSITVPRARRRFERLNAELRRGPTHGSFSAGFAELTQDETLTELTDRADRDLLASRLSRQAGPA